ncbi:MAG: dienelactone hydrolase family protein [Chloroflexota bacterium]
MGQTITFTTTAGDAAARVAPAGASPGPSILLLHPWWGLNTAIADFADRLAGDGFTVMAPDLYAGTVLTTPDDAEAFLRAVGDGSANGGTLNQQRIAATAEAALNHLLGRPDVRGDRAAVIGLSMGAGYGHDLAEARREVVAFVGFYPGIFEPPSGVAYLGHFPELDEFDDSAEVAQLTPKLGEGSAAHVYPGTRHWFIEADRPEFDADAAGVAYERTVKFLREQLA